MFNVVVVNDNAKITDTVFSFGVKFIQKFLINGIAVKFRKKVLKSRSKFAGDEKFNQRLSDLGLIPERLWWGSMTLNPLKVEILLDEIDAKPPKQVLEVGSGTSSALFAAAADKYCFDVLSLENYYQTVEYVKFLLSELSCGNRLTIQVCKFIRRKYSNGDKYRWYNANFNSINNPIDFVLIDGPMGTLVGRNGALPEVIPFLAEDHRIFLDDSSRSHERNCIREWKKHYPELVVEKPSDKCNLAKLHIPNIKSIQSDL